MDCTVNKSAIKGTVYAPTSKSVAHRAFIIASLAKGDSVLYGDFSSDDVKATVGALKALGASFEEHDGFTVCHPIVKTKQATIDCMESGSTLRFILPLAAALGIETEINGRGKLPSRPIKDLLQSLKGIKYDYENKMPFKFSGQLSGTEFEISGDVSSQYVTGLLIAMLALKRRCELKINGVLKSKPYVDITVDVIREFGGDIIETDKGYVVDGSRLVGREYKVEGDFSGASFMLTLGAINGVVTVEGLNPLSKQGDKIIIDVLKSMGAKTEYADAAYTVYESKLNAVDFDATDYPDLAPIIAVAMAKADGISRIKGADRLVDKESDRKRGILKMLTALNVDCKENENEIEIVGKGEFSTAFIDGQADHRMVMAAVVALSTVGGKVSDSEAVAKSYKKFFEDFKNSGGVYVR